MPERVLSKLMDVGADLQLAGVAAALPHANGEDAEFLVELILGLATLSESVGWIGKWERVWAQVTLAHNVASIRTAARGLILKWGWKGHAAIVPALSMVVAEEWERGTAREDDESVEGLLQLAARGEDGQLAGALGELVIAGEPGVALRAARVLKQMAVRIGADVEAGRHIRDAVARACEGFDEHRIGAVMTAAAHALSTEVLQRDATRMEREPLVKWFHSMTRAPHPALLAMMRGKSDEVIKRRCWEWMRFAKLTEACAEGWKIESAQGLSPAAWVAHPVRRGAGVMGHNELVEAMNLGGDAAWSAAKLADVADEEVATVLMQGEDSRVKLLLASEGSDAAVLDVALTTAGPIGELALQRLSGREMEKSAWEALARAGKREALEELARRGEWRRVMGVARERAGVRGALRLGVQMLLRENPKQETQIAEVLRRGSEWEVEVLADVCRGGVRSEAIEDAVLERLEAELAREVEPGQACRLASMLVNRCVAKVSHEFQDAERVEGLLARAAQHGDARVRSNALEAIGKWERVNPGRLAVLCRDALGDVAGRPRATAMRELARFAANSQAAGDVAENVLTMLSDAKPGHRLSATWASERVLVTLGPERAGARWGELCDRLVEVADRDSDQAVRTRASAAARRLMAEIRVRTRRADGVARMVEVAR
ncbi:MAG: hypothetical protein KGS45_13610 [Planctomycetes bacterium]|nr:hypothetical protein [Planctomycetota bacterium]